MTKKGTNSYIEDSRNEFILIYIDAQIVPRTESKISVFDSDFLLEDGIWSKHWYQNVYVSTGFNPYKKTENEAIHQYDEILNECTDTFFKKNI